MDEEKINKCLEIFEDDNLNIIKHIESCSQKSIEVGKRRFGLIKKSFNKSVEFFKKWIDKKNKCLQHELKDVAKALGDGLCYIAVSKINDSKYS